MLLNNQMKQKIQGHGEPGVKSRPQRNRGLLSGSPFFLGGSLWAKKIISKERPGSYTLNL